MNKKILLLLGLCLVVCSFCLGQKTSKKIAVKDFEVLLGTWYGSLTYLDYTSNEAYTMPADVRVAINAEEGYLLFSNMYPDEPHANSTDTVRISKDGKKMNQEIVKKVQSLSNGDLLLTTEYWGVDGNEQKKALIRHLYTIGNAVFIIKKEVLFESQKEWIQRHEYNYKRAK